MTEVEYQYECSRAELLGVPKPTWEEFVCSRKEIASANKEPEEEIVTQQAEETEARKEGFRRIGGGLDELNSILSSTQKKLNRFKSVCGSFSNLLKIHIGTKKEDDSAPDISSAVNNELSTNEANNDITGVESKCSLTSPQHHSKGDTHSELDKLDSLISKAEKAELSLSSQNKQMRKFLN